MKHSRLLRRATLLALMAALSALMALPVSAQLTAGEPEAPAVATFAKNGTSAEVFTFSSWWNLETQSWIPSSSPLCLIRTPVYSPWMV